MQKTGLRPRNFLLLYSLHIVTTVFVHISLYVVGVIDATLAVIFIRGSLDVGSEPCSSARLKQGLFDFST